VSRTKYFVQPLGTQDRSAFRCGEPELDSYFLQRASRDVRENLSAVFVLLAEDHPERVFGYYTLSPQEIAAADIPDELQRRIGKYKRIGVTLLGRLAVARDQQGKKLGEFLLLDALRKSLDNIKIISSWAMVVDAKNEQVVRFYEKYGFLKLSGHRLFLPMKTVEKLFNP
jgi:predicted GNAT family N-acyltransferase